MEEKLRHFSAKKRQFGHEIQPLIFDVNIQHIGPYRLSRPWSEHKLPVNWLLTKKSVIWLTLKTRR